MLINKKESNNKIVNNFYTIIYKEKQYPSIILSLR
jgi:hypothetical protein